LDFADLYFIELRKFDNDLTHIKTALDRWILFLNKATELDKNNLPIELKQSYIIRAIDTIDRMSFNEKERDYYDSKNKVMRDEIAVFQTVYEKGIDAAKIQVARLMKSKGKPFDEIVEFTGLTKEQIENL
jgi:predicted transposase/invertase (TIGR01784 family)